MVFSPECPQKVKYRLLNSLLLTHHSHRLCDPTWSESSHDDPSFSLRMTSSPNSPRIRFQNTAEMGSEIPATLAFRFGYASRETPRTSLWRSSTLMAPRGMVLVEDWRLESVVHCVR